MLSLFHLQKKYFLKAAVPALVLFAALLAGCTMDGNTSPTMLDRLQGEWTSESGPDGYVINGSTLTEISWEGETSYVGSIKHIANLEGIPSGVIIIQYITAPKHAEVGRYGGIYFNGNPDDKVLEFGTAYDRDADEVDMGGWMGAPPVNESSLGTAITLLSTGEYISRYISKDPEAYWYGADYYHEDYAE